MLSIKFWSYSFKIDELNQSSEAGVNFFNSTPAKNAHLKNKIENNSTWEGAFVKMNELKLTQVELF